MAGLQNVVTETYQYQLIQQMPNENHNKWNTVWQSFSELANWEFLTVIHKNLE